jgi:hypothetical protein
MRIGAVGDIKLRWGGIDIDVSDLRAAHESGLPRALEGAAVSV